MGTALASRCNQQGLCWGKAMKRAEKAPSGLIIPAFCPQANAFPEFFTTRCKKALTPGSLPHQPSAHTGQSGRYNNWPEYTWLHYEPLVWKGKA